MGLGQGFAGIVNYFGNPKYFGNPYFGNAKYHGDRLGVGRFGSGQGREGKGSRDLLEAGSVEGILEGDRGIWRLDFQVSV